MMKLNLKLKSTLRLICLLACLAWCLDYAVVSQGQTPPQPQKPVPATPYTQPTSSYPSAEIEAERKKIWKSDEMLAARAWLEDYIQKSAKISDAQGKKYLAELRAMSPDQMKLWLIKFQRQREQRASESETFRRLNREQVQRQMSSSQVGGFRNPYGNRAAASTGLPAAGMRQSIGGQANPMAGRPTVQKPFSSPHYQQSIRPLVTSEDAARIEIMRGLNPWGW
jgi:hypothetical protein